MLIPLSDWQQVSHLYSQDEKRRMNMAKTGIAIGPGSNRVIQIDVWALKPDLRDKLLEDFPQPAGLVGGPR